jgi:hypothetical protein
MRGWTSVLSNRPTPAPEPARPARREPGRRKRPERSPDPKPESPPHTAAFDEAKPAPGRRPSEATGEPRRDEDSAAGARLDR